MTGERGYRNALEIAHKRKLLFEFQHHFVKRIAVFLYGIPLIEHKHRRLARLVHKSRYLFVLFGNAARRVDHNEYHVGTLYRGYRAQYRIPLDGIALYVAFAAHTGRIDNDEILPADGHGRVYRVARRTSDVTHYRTFVSRQFVHKRRFADIGLTHYRYRQRACPVGLDDIEVRAYSVEKIAYAAAVFRRNQIRLTQSERIKIVNKIARRRIGFIHGENYGFITASKRFRYLAVAGQNTLFHVRDKKHHIAQFDCVYRLSFY